MEVGKVSERQIWENKNFESLLEDLESRFDKLYFINKKPRFCSDIRTRRQDPKSNFNHSSTYKSECYRRRMQEKQSLRNYIVYYIRNSC
ncbi:MAG: hypothetical protein QW308_02185 [Candidatus Woesearchaeota archaeon]